MLRGAVEAAESQPPQSEIFVEDQIIKSFPQQIRSYEERMNGLNKDMAHLAEQTHPNKDGFSPMTIRGVTYAEKKEAGAALLAACKAMTNPDAIPLGEYRGFSMELSFDSFIREFKITLKNELRHSVSLGTDIFGNIHVWITSSKASRLSSQPARSNWRTPKPSLSTQRLRLKKPFPHEEELKSKTARLDELNILLNMDKRENELVDGEPDEGEPTGRSEKEHER
jgi:hypothetical protein